MVVLGVGACSCVLIWAGQGRASCGRVGLGGGRLDSGWVMGMVRYVQFFFCLRFFV